MTEKPDSSYINRTETDEAEILTEQEPVRFVLSLEEGGKRLDKIVARRLEQYSRSRIQRWIEKGHVTVNGKPAQAKQTMVGDEEIVVFPQLAEEELAFAPEPVEFPVVSKITIWWLSTSRQVWLYILLPVTGPKRC